ncbi:hypothetical protein BDR03DRAFT_937843 [Suillus americanus]|nr:hypothetical protein BDR03DRAFT_937843 [Suillus americanus]
MRHPYVKTNNFSSYWLSPACMSSSGCSRRRHLRPYPRTPDTGSLCNTREPAKRKSKPIKSHLKQRTCKLFTPITTPPRSHGLTLRRSQPTQENSLTSRVSRGAALVPLGQSCGVLNRWAHGGGQDPIIGVKLDGRFDHRGEKRRRIRYLTNRAD